MKNHNRESNGLKYFMYCRKSSDDSKERQAQSIDSQKKDLRELAEHLNLNVVHIFEEERSAHTTGRPVFAEMLKRLERGEADALLVWHPNRITRNMTDGAMVIALMDANIIKEIKSMGRTYGLDSMDKFVILLEFGISKKDSDDKVKAVKRGLRDKCLKGSMPGFAPLGYLNTPNLPGGSRQILKDPERFDVLKDIWLKMATGKYTVYEIWEILNKDYGFKTRTTKRLGGKPLSLSALYRIFRNTFYYGLFEYPVGSETWYEGSHEPMVSKATFNLIQKILDRNTKTRSQTKEFAYTGIMRCGNCGAQITAEEKVKHQKNGNVHYYIYYHCTRKKDPNCKIKAMKVEKLEGQIRSIVERIQVPQVFENFACKWLKILYNQELETGDKLLSQNDNKRKELYRAMDRLLDAFTSTDNNDKSILSVEEYTTKKKQIKEQIDSLATGVEDLQIKLDEGMLKSKKDFNFATNALEWLEKGTLADKKGLLSELGYNPTIDADKLRITLKKSFIEMSDNHDAIIDESPRLELVSYGVAQRKTDDSSSAFRSLLRGQDLNLRPSGYEPDELPDCSTPRSES